MWAECMQILPSLTWQGLLQHANPCFPLQTHPFQYHPPHTTLTILLNRTATPWMFARLTWKLAETLSNRKASLSNFVHVMSHNSCSLLNVNMVSRHCVIWLRDPKYQELLNGPCVWNQAYKQGEYAVDGSREVYGKLFLTLGRWFWISQNSWMYVQVVQL